MEKGHAKIVEALFRLIAFLQTLDPAKYSPPNVNLTIFSLQALHAAALNALAEVSGAKEVWRTDAKARALLVEKLATIAASAVGLFASLGVDKERVDQAKSYLRKLQGRRASPAIADDPNTPEDESEKSISASQQSSAQMIAHFRALTDFLAAQVEYQGLTDAGLQVSDLTSMADDVEDKHQTSVHVRRPSYEQTQRPRCNALRQRQQRLQPRRARQRIRQRQIRHDQPRIPNRQSHQL